MKMIEFLLETKLFIITIFEIMAAVTGLWYLKKSKKVLPEIKTFVGYLVLIVIFELYAYLPILAYLENYEILSFYKNSLFRRNVWWANLIRVIGCVCYTYIFSKTLPWLSIRKLFKWILVLFSIFSVISFGTSGEFFHFIDNRVQIVAVFIVLSSVLCYYLRSLIFDADIKFYQDLRFYISVGIVIWHLCVVPINIYSGFFSTNNPMYLELSTQVMRYSNIFLYSIITVGFYMELKYQTLQPTRETELS